MADLTITAANVVKSSGQASQGTAAEAITAGQAVVVSSGSVSLDDVLTANSGATMAVSLNDAASGQPVAYLATVGGAVDVGATLTQGETYVVSGSGGISPIGDLLTADILKYFGYATATDSMTMLLNNTGVLQP